ncbi:MAG: hypothetical protein EWV60_16900 [Microcystis sp. Msp_OC_L_20101000_S702]|nr:MAG: hypothetical protein EWV60_16900 [Microcystis sp. Msp_OC_L_20101000_S702]
MIKRPVLFNDFFSKPYLSFPLPHHPTPHTLHPTPHGCIPHLQKYRQSAIISDSEIGTKI